MPKKRILSGVRATGRPHIGNYFGAMKQFVDLQEDYEAFIFIADYHSLIDVREPEALRQSTIDIAIDYLAIGLDPAKTTLFQQSHIPAHTELAWIFDCLMPFAELQRAHAYKDAIANDKKISAGLFGYPVLMAADILMYDPTHVPVGQDQKQHVEVAQSLVKKFNAAYGETFIQPQAYIVKEVAIVPGTDGRKMSKSYDNTIGLFEPRETLEKKVMSITTDSRGKGEPLDPETDAIFAIHRLVGDKNFLSDLKKQYEEGSIGYKESKELLIEKLDSFLAPLREKRAYFEENLPVVHRAIEEGNERARELSEEKMKIVRERTGIR